MSGKVGSPLILAAACGLIPLLAGVSGAQAQVRPIREVFEPAAPSDPSKFGKVAVVQWAPSQAAPVGPRVTARAGEAFKQGNREVLARYIREAAGKGARWVVTPEFGIVGYPDIPGLPPEEDEYRNRDDIKPYVETVPGPTTRYFGQLAKDLKVYIHVGFAEVDPATDIYYNVVVALDPQGQIAGKYRKMNLYQGETNFLSPGTAPLTYASPFGTVGFAICADIYSGNPMRSYAGKVDVLALSASWAAWNSGMDAFKRGARDVRAYVLASNQNYFPDSGVVNPDGTAQSWIRQSDGIAYGYLPLKTTTASRRR